MLQTLGVAFGTVFLAELGDKSQLLALSLSSRYRRPVLLAAVLTASALTIGVSVVAGSLVGQLLPTRVLTVGAGMFFLVYAAVTLRGEDHDEADVEPRARGGFLTAVLALSVSELGDKTMMATFALAATSSAVEVWIGGTLGMATGSAIAVLIGSAVWRRLNPRTVRLASAMLFAAVGIVLLTEAFLG